MLLGGAEGIPAISAIAMVYPQSTDIAPFNIKSTPIFGVLLILFILFGTREKSLIIEDIIIFIFWHILLGNLKT